MIQVSGLCATGGGERLDHITLEVEQGETVAVIGGRGHGGALLLKVLAALTPPSSGSLRIASIDARVSPFEARRRLLWCGEPILNATLSTYEYFTLARAGRRVQGERVSRAIVLDALGLQNDAPLHSLTQSQRWLMDALVAARTGAEAILLDRPFGALAPPERPQVARILATAQSQGATLVIAADRTSDLPIRWNRAFAIEGGRLSPLGESIGVTSSGSGRRLGWGPQC